MSTYLHVAYRFNTLYRGKLVAASLVMRLPSRRTFYATPGEVMRVMINLRSLLTMPVLRTDSHSSLTMPVMRESRCLMCCFTAHARRTPRRASLHHSFP